MGLIDDILKGLPVNPVLREKVQRLAAEKAVADTDNAILKDDLREARAKISELERKVETLTGSTGSVDETDLELLRLISTLSEEAYFDVIASQKSDMPKERVRYHLENLKGADYVRVGVIDRRYGSLYSLTQQGRQLLIQRGLL